MGSDTIRCLKRRELGIQCLYDNRLHICSAVAYSMCAVLVPCPSYVTLCINQLCVQETRTQRVTDHITQMSVTVHWTNKPQGKNKVLWEKQRVCPRLKVGQGTNDLRMTVFYP